MSNYYFKGHKNSTNVRVEGLAPKAAALLFQFLWRWAPGFTRWLTLRMFFAPSAYVTSPEEKACLERGDSFQIQVYEKVVHACLAHIGTAENPPTIAQGLKNRR